MTKQTTFEVIKRRLVNNWSSFFRFKKPKSSRVKDRRVRLSRCTVLSIKTRRFRTAKTKRSKRIKQIVIPLYIIKTKEIAICLKRNKQQKPSEKTHIIVIHIRPKVIMSYALVFFGLAGVALFSYRISNPPISQAAQPISTFLLPTPEPKTDYTKSTFMVRSEPTRIHITRIGVSTEVSAVGRLADGTMETPDVLSNIAGWYKYSPTPGELGPSIIVGHVDNYKGPSIFWRLRELLPGDKVEITRKDGSTATFSVTSIQQFDQANFPTKEVYGNIDYAGIRLITCGGTFNKKTGHYIENTVVSATLIND